MPKIPDWTAVGTATPTPSYRRPFLDQSGEIIAHAIGEAGQGLEQAANTQYTTNVNMARAQASNALLDNEIAVKTQTEQIRQKVASGDLPWNQAAQSFDDWNSQQTAPDIQNLDPVGQENFQKGLKRNVFAGQQAVLGITQTGQRQAFSDQFDAAQDKLGKLAGMPGADVDDINSKMDAYRPLALEAGIPAPTVDKAIQNFKDRNWLNQATQRSMEVKDDMSGLQQLQKDLTDKDGLYAGKLDTDKRNIVLRSVINDQMILQNRAEHEQDKREAKAQSTLGRIDEQISSGIPATPDMWSQWEATTKGTTAEPEFKQRLQDEDQVQQVLRQPIDQQLKYVQDRVTDLQQNGGSLRDRANIMRLQTAVQQNVNLMEKAPLIYAANRNGTQVQPLDFSSIGSSEGQQAVGANVADRMSTLEAMRKQYGSQVAVQPLLPQETAQLTAQLQQSTPTQRAELLTTLRNSFNNDDAYQAAMRQIAPRSPVTAIAGQMIGSQAPASTPVWFDNKYSPQVPDVERVLRGEALLNPAAGGKEAAAEQESGKGAMRGGMPMPDDKQLRITYGQAANGLFPDRPQLADAHYSVFKSAYAALLAEKGDMKGTGDPALEQKALRIALGTPVDFNGGMLSVPSGMDPTRFNGLVRNAVADAVSAMSGPSPQQIFDRNAQYVGKPPAGGYLTKLSPADEQKFQTWARDNKAPVDSSPTTDYDMRGFWQGLQTGDPHAKTAVNPNDHQLHFSDYWKTPYHKSFSADSQWATDGAPKWNDKDQLVSPGGQIVFDERAQPPRVPADWQDRIRGYQLREVGSLGSGRYELTNGSAPLMRPDGKGPFMIDMRNQYLPGTPAATSGKTAGVTPPDPMDKVAMARAAGQQPQ